MPSNTIMKKNTPEKKLEKGIMARAEG